MILYSNVAEGTALLAAAPALPGPAAGPGGPAAR